MVHCDMQPFWSAVAFGTDKAATDLAGATDQDSSMFHSDVQPVFSNWPAIASDTDKNSFLYAWLSVFALKCLKYYPCRELSSAKACASELSK